MSISAIFKIWMQQRHKNIHGRYVKMQDFSKTVPRVEQYIQQATGASVDKAQGEAYISSGEERGQFISRKNQTRL